MKELDVLVNVLRSHLWIREVGANRGVMVEKILSVVGLQPGQPWCAAFVCFIGRMIYGKAAWPLPAVGGCASLGEAAVARGLLRDTPKPGDVFLIYSPTARRFNHTGFVIAVNADGSCGTIEGNTSPDGSPEGTGVFERVRNFKPADRFVRVLREA